LRLSATAVNMILKNLTQNKAATYNIGFEVADSFVINGS
jgi:hypothetical protein